MRFILFAIFIVAQMSGQEVLFEGSVFDSKSKEPIPYVNLSFLNTLKGTSTNEKGRFLIDIQEKLLSNQVHLSSLGYKDTVITAKQLYDTKKFYMVEESFKLDEVVVSQTLGNSSVLNPIGSYKLTSGFSSSSTPWVLALYFPNIGAEKKIIEKITVFLQKNQSFKRSAAKFRLRIYDVNQINKEPNNDLLRKSLVLESDVTKDFVSIDLAAFNIQIPESGVYIGLEWLFVPNNWFTSTSTHPLTNKKVVEDRFAPTFGGVFVKNQNYKAMIFGMGKWTDFKVKSKDRSQNFIPAISMKIKK